MFKIYPRNLRSNTMAYTVTYQFNFMVRIHWICIILFNWTERK
jgi:hypothetical protein